MQNKCFKINVFKSFQYLLFIIEILHSFARMFSSGADLLYVGEISENLQRTRPEMFVLEGHLL